MSVTTNLPHRHKEGNFFALGQLPESSSFEPVAQVFKHLSDAARCRIFLLLCHSEECVLNIAAIMEMSSPAVAHHLRLLKVAGLVTSRRVGKEVFYRAADTELVRAMHRMIEEVMHLSCLQPSSWVSLRITAEVNKLARFWKIESRKLVADPVRLILKIRKKFLTALRLFLLWQLGTDTFGLTALATRHSLFLGSYWCITEPSFEMRLLNSICLNEAAWSQSEMQFKGYWATTKYLHQSCWANS